MGWACSSLSTLLFSRVAGESSKVLSKFVPFTWLGLPAHAIAPFVCDGRGGPAHIATWAALANGVWTRSHPT